MAIQGSSVGGFVLYGFHGAPFGAGAPFGPGGPGGPAGPAGPTRPGSPLAPAGPAGPARPAGPGGPGGPAGPSKHPTSASTAAIATIVGIFFIARPLHRRVQQVWRITSTSQLLEAAANYESLSCAVGVSSLRPAALSQAPHDAANSDLASSIVRTKPLNGPGPFCTPL